MKKLLTLTLCFALSFAAFCQTTILGVIGSSTAAGAGTTSTDSAWINRVIRFYKGQGFNVAATDIAQVGMTCYQGMPTGYKLPANYIPHDMDVMNADTPFTQHNITAILASSPKPSVLIIGYPTNNYNLYTKAEVLFCLDTMRQIALAAGVQTYITTTQPRSDFSQAARDTLRDLKDSILRIYGPFAINFYDGLDSSNGMLLLEYDANPQDDGGYHLNDAGHAIVAQRVEAADIFSTPLPVKLEDFAAVLKNSQTLLSWDAAEETGPTAYQVQRSSDGSHFDPVSVINGTGNNLSHAYHFTDPNPLRGLNYYRLHIVETTDDSYSKITSVFNAGGNLFSRVWPVPTHDGLLNLELQSLTAQTVQVQVVTTTGIVLQSFTQHLETGTQMITMPMDRLSGGFYFLRIHMTTGDIVHPFMKD